MVAPVRHRPSAPAPTRSGGRPRGTRSTTVGRRPTVPDVGSWAVPLVAQVAVLLVGTGTNLTHYVSVADVVAVALAPVWLTLLPRYRGAVALFALVPVVLAYGAGLATLDRAGHEVSRELSEIQLSVLVTGIAVVAVLLWARSVLPWWRVALCFGAGELLDVVGTGTAFGTDGFKYHLGVPLTVVVLALTRRVGGFVTSAAAALALGVVGIVNDARSYMGFCVIAAALALWQAARGSSRRRMRRLSPLLLLAGLGAGSYLVLSNLLLGGYLGAALQAKSVAQVDAAGSLIAGGRPEWAATLQLMGAHPGGFGLGVRPSWIDILVAKRGLLGVGLPIENNGYIDNYMFGQGFDLHSITAELWATYGWAGLLLAATVVTLLVANLTRGLAERRADALVVFLVVGALWDLGFGPLYTNWGDVCLALGLVLAAKRPEDSDPHAPGGPAPAAATLAAVTPAAVTPAAVTGRR